jgi:hypothetical protein
MLRRLAESVPVDAGRRIARERWAVTADPDDRDQVAADLLEQVIGLR